MTRRNNTVMWIFGFALAAAGAILGVRLLLVKIPPGSVGVLTMEWTSGLIEKDYGPGYHWDLGPLHTWNIFDTTVQTLHMSGARESGRGSGNRAVGTQFSDEFPPLSVKSTDGATVTIDVTFKYRIKKDNAWRIYTDLGPGRAYADRIRAEAIDILRPELGSLETEEFYDANKRKEVADSMQTKLQARFDKYHIDLIAILIRDLRFDEQFEDRIKRKVLATQQVELNQSETLAAEEKGKVAKIEAETDAKVKVIDQEREKTIVEMRAENDKKIAAISSEAQKKVAETRSDADLFAALKDAEGVKLRREAEAAGEALRREAVVGKGGTTLVALEFARNLKLGDMTVSTQAVNPLDVQAMLERFGLERPSDDGK